MRISTTSFLLFAGVLHAQAYQISPGGYGPIKIGMTVKEGSGALGVALVLHQEPSNNECYHVYPKRGHEGLSFMVEKGRITRASIYGPPSEVSTDTGIKVGDPESKVLKAYGAHLIIEPHSYGGDNDHYLTFWTTKLHNSGIRFETENGRVVTIHAGSKSIRYIGSSGNRVGDFGSF